MALHAEIGTLWGIRQIVEPPHPVMVFLVENGERKIELFGWGLIPAWSKDSKSARNMANASAETVTTNPRFCQALEARRCVLLCDGFYKWGQVGRRRLPYLVTVPGAEWFAIAGIWANWFCAEIDKTVRSCLLLTTTAAGQVAALDARMPAILERDDLERWCEPTTEVPELARLLRPFEGRLDVAAQRELTA